MGVSLDVHMAYGAHFGQDIVDVYCQRGQEALHGVGRHGCLDTVLPGHSCQGTYTRPLCWTEHSPPISVSK